MISHISNINRNVAALLQGAEPKEVMKKTRMTWPAIVRVCKTCENTRVGQIEKFAHGLGTTLAELTLAPDIETNWYKEANVEYIGTNLRMVRNELKANTMDIGAEIDPDNVRKVASRISGYESGACNPSLGMLQALADVYEMEVADLMLPIELKEVDDE